MLGAILCLLLGPACSQLQNVKGSIGGTVYVDGRPQAFGTVQAYLGDQLVGQERCSQSGHFTIRDLSPGTYTVIYLNASGGPIGGETIVELRLGRFEQVDLELSVQRTGPN
jgi:hypothetical protein